MGTMQSLKELPEIRLSPGQVTADHLVTKCREIFSYAIFMDTEEDWQPAVSLPSTEEGH